MRSREENIVRLKWVLTIAITALGIYLGFKFILPLILPFVIAYFLAWIIRPTTELLNRRLKIPRIIGGTLSLLILTAVTGTGLYFLLNTLLKQASAFIKNVPVYLNILAGKLDTLCKGSDELFGLSMGTAKKMMDEYILNMVDRVKTQVMPAMTQKSLSMLIGMIGAVGILLITLIAAVLIVKDLPAFQKRYENNTFYHDFHKVTEKLSDTGIAWVRTQAAIMVIVAFICVLGLTVLKNEYALLIGTGIAIMDALPILGSGIIFIPWIIIMLFEGNIYSAAILATTYLLAQITREILEPKLIGNHIGIRPLFTLISMYIGFKLFSIAGFFLGPIGLIMFITIIKVVGEKININSYERKMPFEGD